MPDAAVETRESDFTKYRTFKTARDVASFYETEMPKRGWEASADNDLAANGYLEYTKENENAYVFISAQGKRQPGGDQHRLRRLIREVALTPGPPAKGVRD
jgi:hypothetical protein